jgi:iron only hydrogenase large subunit-like protein/uncharacterized Fe-S cluster-containing protein
LLDNSTNKYIINCEKNNILRSKIKMRELVLTREINCQYCYKCLRNCPVKAISFKSGKTKVLQDECIICGKCIEVCPRHVIGYKNDIDELERLIGSPFLVSIAPSFFVHFDKPFKVLALLKELGAVAVQETAVGAEIVMYQYKRFIDSKRGGTFISTTCPVVVELAQKYYPEVIPYLIPILSPMDTHAQFMKKYFGDLPLVYFGSCIAEKVDTNGNIDLVLTFEELERFIKSCNINIDEFEEVYPDPPFSKKGRTYSISGAISSYLNDDWEKHIVVEGIENVAKLFESIDTVGDGFFIEAFSCSGGCVSGTAMRKDLSILKKKEKLLYYNGILNALNVDLINPGNIDIKTGRDFQSQKKVMDVSEERIKEVLKEMGKDVPIKELNCGACGYSTCRDKATAVVLGKAEKEMCLTYLLDKARSVSSAIVENSPNIVIIYKDDEVIYKNPIGDKFFGNRDYLLESVIRNVEDGKNPLEIEVDNKKYAFIVKTFTLPENNEKVILLVDITWKKEKEEELDRLKEESIKKIEEVINRQALLAQEVAGLLGESIAETKSYIVKFKEFLKGGNTDL